VAARQMAMPSAEPAAVPAPTAMGWKPRSMLVRQLPCGVSCGVAADTLTQVPLTEGSALMVPVSPQLAPVLPMAYDAARDSSDLVTSSETGLLVHALPPGERMAKAAFSPRDMRWVPERRCLEVTAVEVASSAPACSSALVLDRDLSTRWAPSAKGQCQITCDLGSMRDVGAVSVVWYAAKVVRATCTVEVSSDNSAFTEVDEAHLEGRGTNSTLRSFVAAEGRYVRFTFDRPVSIYEVAVHGVDDNTRTTASNGE
jgi:hypothetical protein